jgi:signal peptidase I
MSTQNHRWRTLPPDSKIIHPSQQPQRYSSDQEYRPGTWPADVSMGGEASLPVSFVREAFSTLAPALIIAIVIHLFLAQATRVEGYSMEPTLYGHQRLIIEKVSYRFHRPSRGDIVVLQVPGYDKLLIKRVIGLPGETIEIKDGVVWIDGQPLDEPYVKGSMRGSYPPTVIPEGSIFVMGDNRNNSSDSRVFGPVSIEHIVGHAWMRYWPLQAFSLMP